MTPVGWVLRWREGAAAIVAFAAVLVAAFPGVVFGGRTIASAPHIPFVQPATPPTAPVPLFDPYGPGWIHEASLPYRLSALRDGEVPTWSPHEACGLPYFAGLLPGLLFPPNALFLVEPLEVGIDLAYLCRLLIAGVGAYFLLRALGLGIVAAFCGGVFYQLCGYLVTGCNLSNAAVECMVPMLLFALDGAVCRGARRHIVGAALCVFVVLVGGNPESSFLACVVGGGYAAVRILGAGVPRVAAVCRVVTVFACGGLLAMPQLLPFLEFVSLATHSHEPVSHVQAMPWPLAIATLVPGFYASAYTGLELSEIGGMYGIASGGWILAVVGVAVGPRRIVGPCALALVVVYCVYFGVPIVRELSRVPVLNQIHLNKYLVPYLALFPSLLAAFGVDAIRRRNPRAMTWLPIAVLLVVAIFVVHWILWRTGGLRATGLFNLAPTPANASPPLLAFGAVVAGLAIAWGLAGRGRRARTAWGASILVALVPCVEAVRSVPRVYPARGPLFEKPDFVRAVEADAATHRVYSPDKVLYPNTAAAFGLRDVRYSAALKPRIYSDLVGRLFDSPRAYDYFPNIRDDSRVPKRALTLLGVRHCFVAKNGFPTPLLRAGRRDVTVPVRADRSTLVLRGRPRDRSRAGALRVWALDDAGGLLSTIAHGTGPTIDLALEGSRPAAGRLPYLAFRSGSRAIEIRDVTWNGSRVDVASAAHGSTYRRRTARFDRNGIVALPDADRGRLAITGSVDASRRLEVGLSWKPATLLASATAGGSEALEVRIDLSRFGARRVSLSIGVENAALEAAYLEPTGLVQRFDDERSGVLVYENPDAMPRAFGVYSLGTRDTQDEILDALATGDGATVWVASADHPGAGSPPVDAPPPQVSPTRESSHGAVLEWRVSFPADGFLVVLDTFYPGWTARVDGAEAPILRANYAFRAIPVAAGEHVVTLRFAPRRWVLGITLALVAIVGLVSLPRWTGRRVS